MRGAVKYNCSCFWTEGWKHPIATHSALFCTDVTSTKGEGEGSLAVRITVVKRQQRAKKTTLKASKRISVTFWYLTYQFSLQLGQSHSNIFRSISCSFHAIFTPRTQGDFKLGISTQYDISVGRQTVASLRV